MKNFKILTTVTTDNILTAAEAKVNAEFVLLDFQKPLQMVGAIADIYTGNVAFILEGIDGDELIAKFSKAEIEDLEELNLDEDSK